MATSQLLAAALVLDLLFWLASGRRGETARAMRSRGLRSGLLATVAVGTGVAGVVFMDHLRPTWLFPEPAIPTALLLGLMLGALAATAYLMLGTSIMLAGLLSGRGDRWCIAWSWLLALLAGPVLYGLGVRYF